MNAVTQSLAGLPAFLLYFAVGLALLAAFVFVYVRVTPYDEIALIRDGNTAAAISLAGALLGFVLPLASAIAHSVGWVDMVVWAVVAFVAQLAAYFAVSRLVPQFAAAIRAGRTASATLLAAVATAVGILNAASLSY
jgi:putative membrane protein